MRLCVVFGCNGSSNSGASPSPSLWVSQISSMSTRKWSFWVFFLSMKSIQPTACLKCMNTQRRVVDQKHHYFFGRLLLLMLQEEKKKTEKFGALLLDG